MSGIISDRNRFAYLGLVGVLVMLCVGILSVLFPIDRVRFGVVSTVMTILLALPAAYAVLRSLGWRRGGLWLSGLSLYALSIELLGTKTGFPYGAFAYHGTTARLFGLVPWTTPFGWVPLVVGSHALAQRYVRHSWMRGLAATLVLVGLDLALDPGAVALGIWSYADPGRYYGVPLTNFLGWVLTGGVALTAMRRLPVVGRSALMGAGLMMAFWTGVAIGGGQVLPAAFGALAVVGAGYSLRKHEKTLEEER